MPTGYTAALEKMGYDTRRWIKETASRAMGMCVILRDDADLSEADIKNRLKAELSPEENYHDKKLREAREQLTAARDRTAEEWHAVYIAKRQAAQIDFDTRSAEQKRKRALHEKSIKETRALLEQARAASAGDATIGTINFALDQLCSALSFDYGSDPYRDDVLNQSCKEFEAATFKSLLWKIEYHSKEGSERDQREYDRHKAYCELADFIDGAVTD
ncbi:MAG: hypothetical protein V4568_14510 [Pseudomonadota bacterium]